MPKNAIIYCCNSCDFICSKKSNYESHLITSKHKNRTNLNAIEHQKSNIKFVCQNCNKVYKARNSLWYHNKTCNFKNLCKNENENKFNKLTSEPSDKDLIMMLIKQNTELLEVIKSGTHINNTTNNTTNNTNSHNKSFNLQFFLNETCKDAMNIMDFVNSIKLQLSDLENVGKVGFVNGISKIIIQNLNALDETQRPVHCTDKKREIIYVKDDNKWEKDEDHHKKIRKAIKVLAKRNSKLLFDFKDKYPECMDSDSKFSDKYTKLFIEAYGGSGNEDVDNENKIIKNISKEILIDKD